MANGLDLTPVLQAVINAYHNAIEGGYADETRKMTDEQLADDMLDCDADVGKFKRAEVLDAISQYRSHRYQAGFVD